MSETKGATGPPKTEETEEIKKKGFFEHLPREDPRAFLYNLWLKFILLNLCVFAFMGIVYLRGWIDTIISADPTRLVFVISFLFIYGLIVCALRIYETSRNLNLIKLFSALQYKDRVDALEMYKQSRVAIYLRDLWSGKSFRENAVLAHVTESRIASRIKIVHNIAGMLVLLGLVGTVIGFIIALSGVDASKAGDPSSIAPMVSMLIEGMSVALYTTLVGVVLHVWLMMNYWVLKSGAEMLSTSLLRLGEKNV